MLLQEDNGLHSLVQLIASRGHANDRAGRSIAETLVKLTSKGVVLLFFFLFLHCEDSRSLRPAPTSLKGCLAVHET